MIKNCVLAAALLAGATTLVNAQQAPMPMSRFDANGDGMISEEEFNQAREQRMAARAAQGRSMYRQGMKLPEFSDMDANGDGQLTQQEMMAFHQARMQARMKARQAYMQQLGYPYQRGMMSRPGFALPEFTELDENGDGCINQAELDKFKQSRMVHKRSPWGEMPHRGPGYNPPHYQQFDTDKDGRVSQEEYLAGREQRMAQRAQEGRMMRGAAMMPTFEDIDTDGDGSISAEEFAAHHDQHHRMMQGQPPQ